MKEQQLILPRIFQNYMVLQRQKPIHIWGQGPENAMVEGSLNGERTSTTVLGGRWELIFTAMEAQEDCSLILRCGDQQLEMKHIAIGEVWIAGGQSNMEFMLKYDKEAAKTIGEASDSLIRYFDVPKIRYEGQEISESFSDSGSWFVSNPANSAYFSAVGYYFALKIREALQVPVGIIGCNWGGTSALSWMDEEELRKDEGLSHFLSDYQREIKIDDFKKYEELIRRRQEIVDPQKISISSTDICAGR